VEVACEGVYDLQKNAPDTFNVGDVAKGIPGSGVIATAGTLVTHGQATMYRIDQ
jgi:hypothetical protein